MHHPEEADARHEVEGHEVDSDPAVDNRHAALAARGAVGSGAHCDRGLRWAVAGGGGGGRGGGGGGGRRGQITVAHEGPCDALGPAVASTDLRHAAAFIR